MEGLRQRGVDVLTTREARLTGAEDEELSPDDMADRVEYL